MLYFVIYRVFSQALHLKHTNKINVFTFILLVCFYYIYISFLYNYTFQALVKSMDELTSSICFWLTFIYLWVVDILL